MAVSTTNYFSNSAQGIPGIAGDVDLYASHTSPRFALGHRICRQDGAEFVYSHFGAATNRGLLCSQDLSESALVDTDNAVIAPASVVNSGDNAAGSNYVEMTLAATTADQFAGGYLHITDDTGEGYVYRIKGNTATDNPTTGNIRITLYDKLQAALAADSDVAITGSLYANLEAATTTDAAPAGVSMATQAAGDYGWVQAKGVATILQNGAIAVGNGVIIGAVAGAVAVGAAATDTIVGTCLVAGDDTGHGSFLINL